MFKHFLLPIEKAVSRVYIKHLVITRAAGTAVKPWDVDLALIRHSRGDWGSVADDDKRANDVAFRSGGRLCSAYQDRYGVKFWIVTDAGVTTVLVPEDY